MSPKPKQALSCQACRQRKIRCVRPDSNQGFGPEATEEGYLGCIPCEKLGVKCHTETERKKRGPPNSYLLAQLANDTASQPILRDDQSASEESNPVIRVESRHSMAQSGPATGLGDDQSISPIAALAPSLDSTHVTLESCLPRDVAIYIVSLHFDHVHPLSPLLHRPSFISRLRTEDDKADPMFLALLLSVLALTLVHLPKGLLPVIEGSVMDVSRKCYQSSRAVSVACYGVPSVSLVMTRYFDSVYGLFTRQDTIAAAAHGEATTLALAMSLHLEESYTGLDPIETETRRRTGSMIFTFDRAASAVRKWIPLLSEVDYTAQAACEVDDESITLNGYLPQPAGRFAKIRGHNVSNRLFGVIAAIEKTRKQCRTPNNPTMTMSMIRSAIETRKTLDDIISTLPPELRLADIPGQGLHFGVWNAHALQEVREVAPVEGHNISLSILQANIWVTHSAARLLVRSTVDEILRQSGPLHSPTRNAAEQVVAFANVPIDTPECIVTDLLTTLPRIPVQALAVNGRTLLDKIRFVAVPLLDFLPTGTVSDVQPQHQYAQLVEILEILSNIEATLGLASQESTP